MVNLDFIVFFLMLRPLIIIFVIFSEILYSIGNCYSYYFCYYFCQARTAIKCFSSLDGDHITLINVYRASDEFIEKIKQGNDTGKAEKKLRKWCKENFINGRSLRHARDIHRWAI